MTQPPYPVFAPPPPRPRPRAYWFGIGIALILAGVAAGVALFVWTLSAFLHTDAVIDADGQTHAVSVGTDGQRMLWLEDGFGQRCEVVDPASGRPVALEPVSERLSRSDGSGDFHGAYRFDPGSGSLEVTCNEGEGAVLIGAAPAVGSFVAGILATILVPLVLCGLGFLVVLVTGILWALRPARAPGADSRR